MNSSRLLRPLRVLGGLVLALVLILALAVAYLSWSSRPQVTGALSVRGPTGPVEITRDRWGVAHIRATASDEDALFGLGFVHAQDRLWQMEFQRRVAQGRLAEVLGPAAVNQDRFLRTWGFDRAAQSALPALSPRTRSLIRAYTAGVNAAIAQGQFPPEFRLLGYRPEPWTEVDSVAWQKLMAFDLGGNYEDEILGQKVVQTLGQSGLAAVLPPYPAGAPTILSAADLKPGQMQPAPSALRLPPATLGALRANLDAARSLGFAQVPGKGSNDWVVGGARTASGKPLLADDPHLRLSAPMLWYLAELRGPTLHATGATIPGLPGVVIGHNDHLAWGVTNVNPDVQDLYIEPQDAKLSSRVEVIKIKGQGEVRLTVRASRHGPIISDVGASSVGPRVALQWTALQPGDTTYDAFIGLNYARDWADFTAALSRYVAPSQNFVYADTAGNIGYYAPGRVPIRRGGDGSLPVPGDGQHGWTGYIPFGQLPHAYNPPEGLIVTANNRPTPPGYRYTLGNDRNWAEPYRAERILERLGGRKKLTSDDMAATQLDTLSLVWRDLRPQLLQTQTGDPLGNKALDLLRAWDGFETLDSPAASIFEAWLMQLQAMAGDELGDQTRVNSLAVLNQLNTDGPLCRHEIGRYQDCASLLTVTLKRAVADLSDRLGRDPKRWTWRKLHRATSDHTALGGVGAIGWIWNRSVQSAGGTNTVNVARPDPGSYAQTHAPSYRQIIDLSDLNKSRFIGTLGQGGNPLAPHYADQQAMWQRGEYIPMSSDAADWGRVQTLTLNPAP